MTDECGNDCQEALEKLEQFLDGELDGVTIGDISQHLAACYPCADRADFESQLRALVKESCAEKAPESLIERIRLRLDASSADV